MTHIEGKMTKRVLIYHFKVSKTKNKSYILFDCFIDHNRKRPITSSRRHARLNMEQKQRLLNEYQLTKYLTKKMKKELSRELTLPQVTDKVNWQKLTALKQMQFFVHERNGVYTL